MKRIILAVSLFVLAGCGVSQNTSPKMKTVPPPDHSSWRVTVTYYKKVSEASCVIRYPAKECKPPVPSVTAAKGDEFETSMTCIDRCIPNSGRALKP